MECSTESVSQQTEDYHEDISSIAFERRNFERGPVSRGGHGPGWRLQRWVQRRWLLWSSPRWRWLVRRLLRRCVRRLLRWCVRRLLLSTADRSLARREGLGRRPPAEAARGRRPSPSPHTVPPSPASVVLRRR